MVEDTIEFFRSLSGMEAGLRQRAAETAQILRSEETAFVLVSSPRAEAIDEAVHLAVVSGHQRQRAGVVTHVDACFDDRHRWAWKCPPICRPAR